MMTSVEQERTHSDLLEAILAPMGFEMVRMGVFAQKSHPWFHFDLTAIDPKPEVVIPHVMDMLWDRAVKVGQRRAQHAFQVAIGNDPGPRRFFEERD